MNAVDIVINEIIKSPEAYGEGCKLTAYQDSVGKWTIGYGCTGPDIKKGIVWTQQKADAYLRQRVNSAHDEALKASPILSRQSDYKQAAITDLIYNLGLGGYVGHSLNPLIDAGKWNLAAKEILLFNHAGGKVEPGLTARRKKEAEFLLL